MRELLDDLAAGRLTLAQVAADFRTRTWPPRRQATEAQMWGVHDADLPEDDSWQLVETDSRLTAAQYAVLGKAYDQAYAKH
ncbi:hypothetical protein AB0K00_20630 [Dactylosporangium sp. NPDC049525]|uniref:hypothetical protein n=1 Tax=Dactylosporangium sp. NPDC049525 TaxID=3154730 RepID=UPI00343475B0